MSDVGRRFRATRVLEIDFELSFSDVRDQAEAGESALDSAALIASSTPSDDWTVVHQEVSEF